MGDSLPFTQDEVFFSGHAIELRINAEDVRENFRPAVGTINKWDRPKAPIVREDYGYRVGDSVPPFYDSLISKVIVHASTRDDALFNAFQFLKGYRIEGIPTSIDFHVWILTNSDFQGNGIDIGYVERHFTPKGAEDAKKLLLSLADTHASAGESQILSGKDLNLPDGAEKLRIDYEPGGTVLAIPLSSNGTPLDKKLWQRSNTRNGALRLFKR